MEETRRKKQDFVGDSAEKVLRIKDMIDTDTLCTRLRPQGLGSVLNRFETRARIHMLLEVWIVESNAA